jgi:prolipoprotein diacylglyceryltransferase
MYPVLFKIGPITIYALGIFWALGALAGLWVLRLELKRYRYDPEIAANVVIAAEYQWISLALVILGAGLLYRTQLIKEEKSMA